MGRRPTYRLSLLCIPRTRMTNVSRKPYCVVNGTYIYQDVFSQARMHCALYSHPNSLVYQFCFLQRLLINLFNSQCSFTTKLKCGELLINNTIINVIRPHRSTALCGPAIATDGVAWSVCRSVPTVSPAKATEPIVMPSGMRTGVGQRNHCIRWGPDPHT